MHNNQQTIQSFFQCLAGGDYRGMQKYLHPEVEFTDIGFVLQGKQVGAMWHMLCDKGLRIMYRNATANDDVGSVNWQCNYEFKKDESSAPRPIHNIIEARFRFENGLIREHHDTCDFDKWADQALGIGSHVLVLFGTLVGHRELLHEKVRESAKKKIDAFVTAHPEYA